MNKRKQVIAISLVTALVMTTVGCNKKKNKDNEQPTINVEQNENEGSNEPIQPQSGSDRFSSKILNSISKKYSTVNLKEEYETPAYRMSSDHVFEFDASNEVEEYLYKAFKVYDNSDFDNPGVSYCDCRYDHGKVYVEPGSVLYLDKKQSRYVEDGTWGSMNKLYLVQYIDLQTGEDLKKPIVTPFSIAHDLDAVTLVQGVSNNNTYTLSWDEVPGAVEYRVFENIGGDAFELQCTTSNTSVTVEEFTDQKRSENYNDLVKQDLENAGYTVDKEGYQFMNNGVKPLSDKDDFFTVVALDADGKQSGISNIVDARDIAHKLPYTIKDDITMNIKNTEDAPKYVDVEMIDGSTTQMLINYHNAKVSQYEDNKIVVQPHVYNTLFDSFSITLYGVEYDKFLAEASAITDRQDNLNISGGSSDPSIVLPNAPSNDPSPDDNTVTQIITELNIPIPEQPTDPEQPTEPAEEITTEPEQPMEPTEEITPEPEQPMEPTEEITPEPEQPTEPAEEITTEPEQPTEPAEEITTEPEQPTEPAEEITTEPEQPTEPAEEIIPAPDDSLAYQLYQETALAVDEKLASLGDVQPVIYANNDLEAWISYCLITQMPAIPVPISVYPEAANTDYLYDLLYEAYRQNPSSGFLCDAGYSYDYEALVVKYTEDVNERLEKTVKELDKAKSVANSVTNSSMSDADKVFAINDYLCANASYDFDSCSTDTNISEMSTAFLDAHTPYGILCNNYGVCESYAEAFALIGRYAGLDVLMEIGTLDGGGHEWNRVCVDGSWCIVDVTNNDMDLGGNALLNVTESQAQGVLVPDDTAYLTPIESNDDTKEYYYLNGMSVTSLSEALTMLESQLANSDTAQVRIPIDTSSDEINDMVQQLLTDLDLDSVKGGVFANVLAIGK